MRRGRTIDRLPGSPDSERSGGGGMAARKDPRRKQFPALAILISIDQGLDILHARSNCLIVHLIPSEEGKND